MLTSETQGPVLRLTLNRPEVRNALNDELIKRLADAFAELPESIRAVVITGEGKGFCAGGDMEWMRRAASFTEEESFLDALHLARMYEAIVDCPALTIAAVNGGTYGGGCGLVAACDLAIAAATAKFSFSEVKLGLVPATISPHVLYKIGPGHARALFATGEVFAAERAYEIGLVHQVVAEVDLAASVDVRLKEILALGPRAVTTSKRVARIPVMTADESARLLSRIRSGEEAREGIAAFLEKRKPAYDVSS